MLLITCNHCGSSINIEIARQQQDPKFTALKCPVCGNYIDLDKVSDSNPVYPSEDSNFSFKNQKDNDFFDVFLCYNLRDESEVIEIAQKLKKENLAPWLDIWETRPGLPWQISLKNQMENIKSVAVFTGKENIAPWEENSEIRVILRDLWKRKVPIIPVLLKNAYREKLPELPFFLMDVSWIDFHKKEPDPMKALIWGITGKKDL